MLDNTKLCRILSIKNNELSEIVEDPDKHYYPKVYPKLDKNGVQLYDKFGSPKVRNLYESKPKLKVIQSKIHQRILKMIKLPNYFFGGIKLRDNIIHAKMHQGNKYFFITDLKDFYPNISHKQVYAMFKLKGFVPSVANILTKLTTYKGQLPQGIPTSPYLANLVFAMNAGKEINSFSKSNNFIFTAFVDDLVVSAKEDFKKDISSSIVEIIKNSDFRINHKKTSYITKDPIITGIKVRNNGIYLPDNYYKTKIKGIEDKESPQAKGILNYLNRVNKISKTKKSKVIRNFQKTG